MCPLSILGQKLRQCSPPARKRLCIALLLVSMSPWTLLYLLYTLCPCLPAPLLYHSLTRSIHIPTLTASSHGRLTQCLIHLLLTSTPGVFWRHQRWTPYKIKVHTNTSVRWSTPSANSRSRDRVYVCLLCACSRISFHSECQWDPDWEQQLDEYQRLWFLP